MGPAGVLVRDAIETDDGTRQRVSPQRPWLVRPDLTVVELPFELGVSPLTALPDGRWLLPGADPVWRDDLDEPLSLLTDLGGIEPLLAGGRPVPASRVLREATPALVSGLEPLDPAVDVPWSTVAARLDAEANELLLAIAVRRGDATDVIVAGLRLDGRVPARLVEHLRPAPGAEIAAAP